MAQRRHVLTRVSDETGAVLSGASAYVLRAGARVTQVQAISANSTATVKLRHPGALKLNDVVWVVRDDALEASTSLQYRVNSTPSYNSGVWDVTLLDLTGSDGGVNANDRLVLDYTDSDHYVTWYTDDTTTSGTSGALSVSATTGKVEFYVEEPDVDVAVVVSGSATYFTDLVAGTRPFVTPEEFGAVGDGVTDDSNAVQAALDYVSEVAGGGVVWFGSGDGYSVTGVSATSADVQLAGYSVPVGISGGKPRVLFGSGSPESAVTAPIGSIYLRSDQATGIPQLYAKETGTGNGGWREVNSTSGLVVNADLSMGGYDIVLTDNVIFTQGSGSPESVVTASIGSLYLDKTNGVAYIKESGSGNTGWDAVNTDALPLAGGTMTGDIDLSGNDITMGGGVLNMESGNITNVGIITGIGKHVNWTMLTRAVGTYYAGGFYEDGATANDFNPSITLGTANSSYAAHVYFVAAAGATDTQVTVTGTSITDGGTRTTSDTEVVSINNASANTYYETSKKWIGQVTLNKTAGTDRLCNYGFVKYWDDFNTNFTLSDFEATFQGGANDSGFNIELIHHKSTGWTYNAGSTATKPTPLASLQTVHNTEYQLVNGEPGAFKVTGLAQAIAGSGNEGLVWRITTTAVNAVDYLNLEIEYEES